MTLFPTRHIRSLHQRTTHATRRLWQARTFAAAVVATALLFTACSNTDGLIADSTAPVLVATDAKFLGTLEFDAADAANNYEVRSNASAEFDPNINPDLFIASYQINDVAAWPGPDVDGRQSEADAFVNAVSDAATPSDSGPCVVVVDDPVVVECTYDVGQVDLVTMFVRQFDNADSTTMIVVGALDARLDYISGDFTTMTPAEAGDTFPRD